MVSAVGAYWLGSRTGGFDESFQAPALNVFELNRSRGIPSTLRPYINDTVLLRGDRSFDDILEQLRSKLHGMDLSDPKIAESLLLLGELNANEIKQLLDTLDSAPLEGVSVSGREHVHALLYKRWGKIDHQDALEHLLAQPPERNIGRLLKEVVGGWAQRDPEAAMTWVLDVEPKLPGSSSDKRDALTDIYKQWALRNPDEAMASLPLLERSEAFQQGALRGLALTLKVPERRESLLLAMEKLPDSGLREKAVTAAIDWLGHDNAAQWIEGLTLSKGGRKAVRDRLTVAWVQQDPRAAGKWLLETGAPSERAETIDTIVMFWSIKDRNAAAEWISEIGLNSDTDGAVRTLAEGYARIDAKTGIAWAQRITSQEQRVDSLTEIFRRWRSDEPAAAMDFLANADLDDHDLELIVEKLGN